ncbi:DUF4040 domain-containing protein [Allorhodopirellula heiligendammensis]|uniref:Monovalent cation/H+ antiporter subunit B n=1 Tax=Allorhodopirellula heiligendammensis TaxID=2714739 RepID=A0A5C6BYV2_9BACT|nr:DUF4040 domain-containing protein [Allorhodopirellula heiligendammensis]TWU16456.1 putative monovalent cation/H+ antiporter subunit B [Allorhodopirellula heiligendammensis]|tara:strand:- start:1185 stop:1751 length:567 start_codon:yes stop_codon:yes gene_type:complete
MNLIVFALLALLAITAVVIARLRELWAAIMFTGIYSFLSASWMMILDAPDVAFTEAAVGAGISTVLMLSTMALTGQGADIPRSSSWMPLLIVVVTGATLVYGTLDMPYLGAVDAPVQLYPSPSYVERSAQDMHGLPNVVTALLASYRGYDTLGETTVVLTAGIAVLLILRRDEPDQSAADAASPEETA